MSAESRNPIGHRPFSEMKERNKGGEDYLAELGNRLASDASAPPRPLGPDDTHSDAEALPPVESLPSDVPDTRPSPDRRVESDVHVLTPSSDELETDDEPLPADAPGDGDPFSEFEELESESTNIDEEHLLAEQSTSILHEAPEPPVLFVEAGKDLGKQFVLNVGDTSVGRSIDNDVILTDLAVSRRHLRVHRSEDGVLRLHDLGSGNGSLLNEQRVHESVLKHGDRIALGETVLVVRIPGIEPAAAPVADAGKGKPAVVPVSASEASAITDVVAQGRGPNTDLRTGAVSPKAVVIPRGWLIAILTVGGIAVALLGATITALVLRPNGSFSSTAPVPDEQLFEAAVTAYEDHRWDEAEIAFREVLAKNSRDARAQVYLEKIRDAREHERLLMEARYALEQGDATRALSRAASVPAGSPLAKQAEDIRREARDRQVGKLIDAARKAWQARDYEEAERKLEEARTLDDQSEQFKALEALLAKRDNREVVPEPKPEREKRTGGDKPATTPTGPNPRVLAAYQRGDFASAAAIAREGGTASGTELATRIEKFAEAYQRIQKAGANTASVVRQLQTAIALDRGISGGHYVRTLKKPLMDAYLAAARSAFARNDAAVACENVRQAQTLDGSDAAVATMARDCERRAAQMVAQAGALETRDIVKARAMYREVLVLVPSSSASYQRAYRRLNALGRPAGKDEDE